MYVKMKNLKSFVVINIFILTISTTSSYETIEKFVFSLNAQQRLYLTYNESAEVGGLLDYKNNISCFSNGNTGEAFLFRYEIGEGVYIPSGVSDKTWRVSEKKINDYFYNIASLEELYKIGETSGIDFKPGNLPDLVAKKIAEIILPLSQDYTEECQALLTVLYNCQSTSDDLRSTLVGFENVMGDVNAPSRGDLKWLVEFFHGMDHFFAKFDGGMTALTQKNVHLDFANVISQSSGIKVLIVFLEKLSPHFDLATILKPSLDSEVKFFEVIDKLGGNLVHGYDGFIHALTEIVQYIHGENSKENVLHNLKHFLQSKRTNLEHIGERLISDVQALKISLQKLNLHGAFPRLTKLLDGASNENLQIKGINVSRAMKLILSVRSTFIEPVLTSILELLKPHSIPTIPLKPPILEKPILGKLLPTSHATSVNNSDTTRQTQQNQSSTESANQSTTHVLKPLQLPILPIKPSILKKPILGKFSSSTRNTDSSAQQAPSSTENANLPTTPNTSSSVSNTSETVPATNKTKGVEGRVWWDPNFK